MLLSDDPLGDASFAVISLVDPVSSDAISISLFDGNKGSPLVEVYVNVSLSGVFVGTVSVLWVVISLSSHRGPSLTTVSSSLHSPSSVMSLSVVQLVSDQSRSSLSSVMKLS